MRNRTSGQRGMLFQQFGERYVVRLEASEPVIETLTGFLTKQGVGFANVSAAGAINRLRLGSWDPDRKEYQFQDFDEQLEVVSFQGNASIKDGKPFLHIHGVFGRSDYSVIGGHVKEAWTYPTFEVWLRTEDIRVSRAKDQATGLDFLDLSS
ncbi:MAG TPA: DUF296 domain-containing protein [Chloroflexota bacterium]